MIFALEMTMKKVCARWKCSFEFAFFGNKKKRKIINELEKKTTAVVLTLVKIKDVKIKRKEKENWINESHRGE